jgi:two-component system, LytTR family, sensor kinase
LALPSINIRKQRWIFAAGFLLLVAIQANVLHNLGFSWQTALWDSAVTNICVGAGCMLIANNLRYYFPGSRQYIILFSWCLTVAGFCSFIPQLVLKNVWKSETAYIEMLEHSGSVRYWMAVLITSWVAVVNVLLYRQQENTDAEKRKADAEKLARDAELYKLRQQLQPHFLFNSLNSISALAGSQPEEARKMIHQLSEFLRGTLRKEEHQWVTLSDELQHLALYLDIEKVRFGHRLSTVIDSDEAAGNMRMPPMLLQPLVENAIKFGLYDTTEALTVRISAKAEGESLVLEVKNPFDPETSIPKGTGFGLSSIQRRLYLLFARNDLLATQADGKIFTTTVKIPQHDQSNSDR